MKKRIAFLCVVVGVLLMIATMKTKNTYAIEKENKDDLVSEYYFSDGYIGYRYPILPGMSSWPYGNHQAMTNACQIPEQLLTNMTTDELLVTVLYYPLFGDIYAYDSLEMGYEVLKKQFNGLRELCNREDRYESMTHFYSQNEYKDDKEDSLPYSDLKCLNGRLNSSMFATILLTMPDFATEEENSNICDTRYFNE